MADPAVQRLGLGTVQWGMPYGVANRRGQRSIEDVRATLAHARQSGIRILDTAQAYGSAEQVLGQTADSDFKIVTKTLPLKADRVGDADVAAVARAFDSSLINLARKRVYGLLVHHAENLFLPG